jgi:hypothetical protein
VSTLRGQIIAVLERHGEPEGCGHLTDPARETCSGCRADAILAVVEPALQVAYGDGRDDEAAGLPVRDVLGAAEAAPSHEHRYNRYGWCTVRVSDPGVAGTDLSWFDHPRFGWCSSHIEPGDSEAGPVGPAAPLEQR